MTQKILSFMLRAAKTERLGDAAPERNTSKEHTREKLPWGLMYQVKLFYS